MPKEEKIARNFINFAVSCVCIYIICLSHRLALANTTGKAAEHHRERATGRLASLKCIQRSFSCCNPNANSASPGLWLQLVCLFAQGLSNGLLGDNSQAVYRYSLVPGLPHSFSGHHASSGIGGGGMALWITVEAGGMLLKHFKGYVYSTC